jgi:Ni/Co efflux regulator RcnB
LLLPRLFLSSAYYFDSYARLGLEPPPPGYRWVRYGPDLLLVQNRTRRIVDVIYGAFI